jgi:hypothetical protein
VLKSKAMRFTSLPRLTALLAALGSISLACSDDSDDSGKQDELGDGDGDGDGDAETGDGDAELLPSDFLAELTKVRSCGDVHIGVSNEAETFAILFVGAPLAATAHELEATQVRETSLPSDDVSLRLVIGEQVDRSCNDVIEPGDHVINHEWTAVSGTVSLTVVPKGVPQPWEVPADATLVLTDLRFEAPGLDPVLVESWTVADVFVGWFPG